MITKLQTTCIYGAFNKKTCKRLTGKKVKGDYLIFWLLGKSKVFDFICGSSGLMRIAV
jgi:hypothetical protein